MPNDHPPKIKAVDRTLTILEVIADLDGATLSEIHERVDLSKSSVYNHLQTHVVRNYVEIRDGRYYPALNFLTLGGAARTNNDLYEAARPVVDTVAEKTDELAMLTTESEGESVYLYRSGGMNAMSADSYVGCRLPLHCSGAGKVLLAFMDRGRIKTIVEGNELTKWTPNTMTEPEALYDELEEVRSREYALDDEERLIGMRGVATPIRHRQTGVVLGTLGVSGPTSRIQGSRFRHEYPKLLRQNADEIEVEISYL